MTSQTKCWCGHHERYHGGDSCTFCDKGQLNEPHPFGLRKPTEENPLTLRKIMALANAAEEQPASVADGSGSSSLKQARKPAITPPDSLGSNLINRENPRPTGLIKTIGGTLVGIILGIWVFVVDRSLVGLFALPFAGFLCGCGLAWVTGSDPDSPYSKERKRREKSMEEIRQKWNRKQFPDEDD
jgi:hypothetical protein